MCSLQKYEATRPDIVFKNLLRSKSSTTGIHCKGDLFSVPEIRNYCT